MIIFVSADKDEESFSGYFSKMPWLAIPFSDAQKRDTLDKLFKRSPERLEELKDQEEAAKRNQSLTSLLVHGSLTRGLEKLKAKGESFEIVQIPFDDDEASFNQSFGSLPWFSLPLKDKNSEKLVWYFELSTLPTLVIIGQDGKTVHSNVAETVKEHGVAAYPFTPEKFAELAEIDKKREESQTLESILVSGDLDFVIEKDGTKIPVADLVGKTPPLLLSTLVPSLPSIPAMLTEAYEKIKATDNAFEVIFLSSDKYQSTFDDYFAQMPWLALPFGDERKKSLSLKFEVRGIPTLVAIGPTGQTVTKEARDLISEHGADAYPFTAEHLKKLEEKLTRNEPDEGGDEEEGKAAEEEAKEGGEAGEVCDGEVCYKA
ncbi:LOW QUALITY PROTEIN: hypothetical protein EUGRSUZ_H02594 [Eucalyptus grandis]|uniref:Uncharacterized protein n=1 Tax=Eucalyptus grandis TaxID=71139 RepID=A0ACC3JS71_EUCGR|nr:LOW QUALITY PROTEIN: hypothetical protein EUGRSUZ_H02594 [Eucalyptus grandis]